ncbi:YnjH family protein [Vibrio sp.]|nr:YnjH family protein [Vibrio sp.]
MMKYGALLWCFWLPVSAFASETDDVQSNTLNLELTGETYNQAVCWYDNKAYSRGSVVTAGELLLKCDAKTHFELNGPVEWKELTNNEQDGSKPIHTKNEDGSSYFQLGGD